jgi:hypothetical protein
MFNSDAMPSNFFPFVRKLKEKQNKSWEQQQKQDKQDSFSLGGTN